MEKTSTNKDFKGSDLTMMNMLEYMIHQKNIYNKFIKFIMYGNNINMPIKTGANKGLLTTGEIRKLISAHNKLSKIVVPKGTDREGLEKLIKSNGYKINHKEQRLDPSALNRPPQKTINMPPKKLTEKQKAKQESQKASLKIFLDNSAKAKKEFDKKMSAKKVSVVKPSQSFNVKNTKVAQVKNKPPPVKKDIYPAYVPTEADKKKDKLIKDLEIVSTRLKETLLKNKNNFGFNSDPVNTNKDFKELFQQLVTQLHTKDLKKLPVIMENIKSIVNTINAYPPKDNEGIKSPLIKYPALSDRTDPKNFKNFINEKSRLSRNKILKERRDALKPKKEVVKKPAVKKPADMTKDLGGDLPTENYGGQSTQSKPKPKPKPAVKKVSVKKPIPKPPPVSKPNKGVKVSQEKSEISVLKNLKSNCMEKMKFSKIFLEGVKENWSTKFLKDYEKDLSIRFESELDFRNYEQNFNDIKNTCGISEANIYKKAFDNWIKQNKIYVPKPKPAVKKPAVKKEVVKKLAPPPADEKNKVINIWKKVLNPQLRIARNNNNTDEMKNYLINQLKHLLNITQMNQLNHIQSL